MDSSGCASRRPNRYLSPSGVVDENRDIDRYSVVLISTDSDSSSSFSFSLQGSPQWIIHLHSILSSASFSVTSTSAMSSLATSINLLFGRPLFLFPGSSILNILLPIYPSSFLSPPQSCLSCFISKLSHLAAPLRYSFLISAILVIPRGNLNIFNSATSISRLVNLIKFKLSTLTYCALAAHDPPHLANIPYWINIPKRCGASTS